MLIPFFNRRMLMRNTWICLAIIFNQGVLMGAKTRSEIPDTAKWNVESIYPDIQRWEKEYQALSSKASGGWQEIRQFEGKLASGPLELKKLLDTMYAISRTLEKIYTYAHLRHDEDVAFDAHKTIYARGLSLYQDFDQATSWINPEILALDQKTLEHYLASKELADYHTVINKLLDQKKYVLPADQEKLLALSSKIARTPYAVFNALNNADLRFKDIYDSEGNQHPLTHGTYSLYLQSQDRTLRKNAFTNVLSEYKTHENTLAEVLNGVVQSHIFSMKARGYESCLQAALQPHQINRKVYDSLISEINANLSVLHDYVNFRKEILGLDQIHFYDLYVPLVEDIEMDFSYEESSKVVLSSVKVLGREYQETLKKGLTEERWVDIFENQGKRSGAYSSGCFDSYPFILMNYTNTLRDLKTLAHEAGHSMHTYLSQKTQPYHYANYPIFVAEVASTFNEELAFQTLIEKAKSKKERIYLLCQNIEDIRATLFRQTMFAEFELRIHQLAETEVPLTPQVLKQTYRDLNVKYFGPSFTVDEELDYELFRIPHFFYNFYVYQYATGMSAAHALVEKVRKEGESARDN
ncbi:MAG: oligoendopeptidase F, partial [Chlamydiae bacterium]|nr:oligoendopeptidase F [Chlamydiota bacterium]